MGDQPAFHGVDVVLNRCWGRFNQYRYVAAVALQRNASNGSHTLHGTGIGTTVNNGSLSVYVTVYCVNYIP